MEASSENVNKLTDHLFRHEAGKMVAVLTRIFGLSQIEIAEDIVQDAFAQALKEWKFKTPPNPSAWLMMTAKNKAIDLLRRERYKENYTLESAAQLRNEYTSVPIIENLFMHNEIKDSQLRMIFACCHPSLAEADQIAFTLKICSGFSVDEIAAALLSNTETIKKRIQRARKLISEKDIKFDIPLGNKLKKRLDVALHSIYLLFNEGYNSSNKSDLIRQDLCEEAIRLALMLSENEFINQPKCSALVALMSLLASRFESRLDSNGEIILLEEQDRSKWNTELINIGLYYLNKSSEGNEISDYHIEAAIVAEHSIAKSFNETNWNRILQLYDILSKINSSPVVLLNRAIVIGKLSGAAKAIEEINLIPGVEKYLKSNHLFSAVLGEMYKQENNSEEAKKYFEMAYDLTNSETEKKLIQKKINLLQ
ncbi:MAG: sigma-70 family RNA polymerase sigma factor [Bacteroidetes bacterium]|nr:sigma-70 family RNA polymerase sigma factor [Bacteroidota bacterium]